MKRILVFQFIFVACLAGLFIARLSGSLPVWVAGADLWFTCILLGGLGGSVYCLRAVYINYCAKNKWVETWIPWYFIRPFVSLACGGISCLFLKAGLLLLESTRSPDSTNLGFYGLAFIAGLNVDKFLSKIEDIAHASWGIEKSGASRHRIPVAAEVE